MRFLFHFFSVLFVVVADAKAAVVFMDTLPSASHPSGTAFGDSAPGSGLPQPQNSSLAFKFIASAQTLGVRLSIPLEDAYPSLGLPTIGIYTDFSEVGPEGLLSVNTPLSASVPITFENLVVFEFNAPIEAGLIYWIILSANDGDKFHWMGTDEGVANLWISTNASPWAETDVVAGGIRIEGIESIPEAGPFLLAGWGAAFFLLRRLRTRSSPV